MLSSADELVPGEPVIEGRSEGDGAAADRTRKTAGREETMDGREEAVGGEGMHRAVCTVPIVDSIVLGSTSI